MNINTKEAKKNSNEIKVTRAFQFDDGKIVFDVKVNGVSIYGCRLMEGGKGKFIGFPSRKGKKEGEYYAYARFDVTEADMKNIVEQIEKM